jgi:signal transduction histidine kinase
MHRRFLGYFLLLSAFTVVATVAFEVYSFRRVIDHSLEHNLLFAKTVSRVVGGLLDEEGAKLDRALQDVAKPDLDDKALAARLTALRKESLDQDGAALFDGKRHLLAADLGPAGLPPPHVILPPLRRAEMGGKLVASDLWKGKDGKPRVALVKAHAEPTKQRDVITFLRLDGVNFQRAFSAFLVNDQSRLQLLDGSGVALFSTRPAERWRSAVHGTYFTDQVRLGKTAQMPCHSCHRGPDSETVREHEITTVAPLTGTDWSVTVREGTADLFAPMRETVYASSALVAAIFGAFVGFYLMLSRRVLKPMRELAATAVGMANERDATPLGVSADDELAVMRQSLQTIQAKATKPVQVPTPAPTPDAATLPIAGLHDTLQALVDGAAASAAVDAAVLWLADRRTAATWLVASGVTVNAPGPGFDAAIGARSHMTAGELAAAGMVVDGVPATRGFVVQRVDVLDRLHGHLWLAMHDDTLLPALQPVIGLVAVQVQGLVERALLLDELGQEQARKNRMLRHLFDAEAEERKHIAREIHDETAQELTALSLLLETASGAEPRPELERAKVLVGEILGGIQRLIRRLRPALLDDLGLCEAISATADSVLKPHGIAFELAIEGRKARLPGEIENALYRVVQEAFTNVVRHAGAKHVWLTLHGEPDRVTLRLEDDGKGLPPNAAEEAHERPRWGLLGMRERIEQLDGSIAFSARAGGGLTIVLAVPLSPLLEA